MSKQPEKHCPRCGEILVRVYVRGHKGKYQPYVPIGNMCPTCRDEMLILDQLKTETIGVIKNEEDA